MVIYLIGTNKQVYRKEMYVVNEINHLSLLHIKLTKTGQRIKTTRVGHERSENGHHLDCSAYTVSIKVHNSHLGMYENCVMVRVCVCVPMCMWSVA